VVLIIIVVSGSLNVTDLIILDVAVVAIPGIVFLIC